MDATDEEVYKAALRANAVGFIEGEQVTYLEPGEEHKAIKTQLDEKLATLKLESYS